MAVHCDPMHQYSSSAKESSGTMPEAILFLINDAVVMLKPTAHCAALPIITNIWKSTNYSFQKGCEGELSPLPKQETELN